MGAIAAWAVLTAVFAMFTVTRDWVLGSRVASAARGGADQEAIREIREEYLAERGMDRPLLEQYLDWMGNMFTLRWGDSFETGEAVFPLVVDAVVNTAAYVVPAILLATVLGLAIGLYAAMNSRSGGETGLRTAAYLSFGFPNFWIAYMVLAVTLVGGIGFRQQETAIRPFEQPFLVEYVLPAVLVATTLLAAVLSYARAYSLQHVSSDVTTLVRAKGGSRIAVARHVLRNAAIPLVSLVFVETIALLALSVFVIEAVFAIDGLGLLFYNAVWTRDLPVLMGGTMAIVVIGVAGNVFQDVAYSALDPRVDTGTR